MTSNNYIPISTMEDRPEQHLYKLMGQILGLYENDPYNLLGFEEKDEYLYSFIKIFPQEGDLHGITPNKREKERLQITFDKVKYPQGHEAKEQLKVNSAVIIFGRLNINVNKKTGGRSFSVLRMTPMPERLVEIKDPNKGTIEIKLNKNSDKNE